MGFWKEGKGEKERKETEKDRNKRTEGLGRGRGKYNERSQGGGNRRRIDDAIDVKSLIGLGGEGGDGEFISLVRIKVDSGP